MVKTLAINANNDLYLGPDGNIVVAVGIDAVAQACKTATQALLGEMIYSTDKGVPYFETLFQVGQPNLPQFEAGFRQAVLNVEGVVGINDLVINHIDDTVSFEMTITTIYGQTSLSNTVNV